MPTLSLAQYPERSAAPPTELKALVARACEGDEGAWRRLVARFDPMARRIARGFGLKPCDVDDVTQAAWLQIYTCLGRVREPEALSGWIATIVRREALRSLQTSGFEHLVDDPMYFEQSTTDATNEAPEAHVLASERTAILTRAFASLPPRHRTLMALIVAQDAPDYRSISLRLDMPIGSIGPIRRRCLARLEAIDEVQALRD
jgi:RNA polymerase sigma factor (sigma-70 family)